MDEIYRETFTNCYAYLVNNIQYDNLIDVLISYEVLSKATIENINSLSERRKQVRKLIDALPRRKNETFQIFLHCLEITDQKHIAEKLKETYSKNYLLKNGFPEPEKNLNPSYEPLTKFPVFKSLPEHNIKSNKSKAGKIGASVLDTESTNNFGPERQQSSNECDCYTMDSNPCGYILIINNEIFTEHTLDDRNGSTKDANDLRNLFGRLGFFCDIKNNLNVEEIKRTLLEFSKLDDNKKLCCCAVVLMSHGDEGNIYGSGGKKISVDELIVYFSDQNCPNLKDKPKLFIIQACRNNVSPKPQKRDLNDVSQKRDINGVSQKPLMRLMSIDLSSDTAVKNSRADMLIAYSTASGNKSYRHKMTGSIFIQNIIDVFGKKADTTSVTDMLIEVNRKLREQYPNHGQIGAPEVALTKKWFLKPIKNN